MVSQRKSSNKVVLLTVGNIYLQGNSHSLGLLHSPSPKFQQISGFQPLHGQVKLGFYCQKCNTRMYLLQRSQIGEDKALYKIRYGEHKECTMLGMPPMIIIVIQKILKFINYANQQKLQSSDIVKENEVATEQLLVLVTVNFVYLYSKPNPSSDLIFSVINFQATAKLKAELKIIRLPKPFPSKLSI